MNNKWFVFGGPNGESYNSAMIYQIDLTAFSSVKFIYGFEWDDPLTYRISVSTDSMSWVPLVTQFSNDIFIDDSVTTSLLINYIKLEQYGTSFSGAYYTKYKYLRLFEDTGGVGLEEEQSTKKTLVGILDLLGRVTDFVTNTALIYVYDDGSREKVLVLE
jgi:hypothetical protein